MIRILTLVISLNLATYCFAAEKKICTREEAMQAENDTDNLKDWNSIYLSFKRFAHCDDAAISEGYSDAIGKMLALHWEQLSRLIEFARADDNFREFVIRHIDETVPLDQLKIIIKNAQEHCPVGEEKLCKSIETAAQ